MQINTLTQTCTLKYYTKQISNASSSVPTATSVGSSRNEYSPAAEGRPEIAMWDACWTAGQWYHEIEPSGCPSNRYFQYNVRRRGSANQTLKEGKISNESQQQVKTTPAWWDDIRTVYEFSIPGVESDMGMQVPLLSKRWASSKYPMSVWFQCCAAVSRKNIVLASSRPRSFSQLIKSCTMKTNEIFFTCI